MITKEHNNDEAEMQTLIDEVATRAAADSEDMWRQLIDAIASGKLPEVQIRPPMLFLYHIERTDDPDWEEPVECVVAATDQPSAITLTSFEKEGWPYVVKSIGMAFPEAQAGLVVTRCRC